MGYVMSNSYRRQCQQFGQALFLKPSSVCSVPILNCGLMHAINKSAVVHYLDPVELRFALWQRRVKKFNDVYRWAKYFASQLSGFYRLHSRRDIWKKKVAVQAAWLVRCHLKANLFIDQLADQHPWVIAPDRRVTKNVFPKISRWDDRSWRQERWRHVAKLRSRGSSDLVHKNFPVVDQCCVRASDSTACGGGLSRQGSSSVCFSFVATAFREFPSSFILRSFATSIKGGL